VMSRAVCARVSARVCQEVRNTLGSESVVGLTNMKGSPVACRTNQYYSDKYDLFLLVSLSLSRFKTSCYQF
jgi:hypothetical protein